MQVQLYVALWPVLLFPEMSDGHLQANARGGVSGETLEHLETTSQLYALLL